MTDTWLTPPHVLQALGGAPSFDLDPCAAEDQPWKTAQQHYTWRENGLHMPWFGRVWLNPPYSRIAPWMGRMATHGRGVALVFAKTDTQAFSEAVFDAATALFFIRGRLRFCLPCGAPSRHTADAPSVLIAYGQDDAAMLAELSIEGSFVPLRVPRIYAAATLEPLWSDVIASWLRSQKGPVQLSEIYRALSRHPKARGNRTFEATIRRVLQEGAGRRVARGVWVAA